MTRMRMFERKACHHAAKPWFVTTDANGIQLTRDGQGQPPHHDEVLTGFVTQLVDDGLAASTLDGYQLSWQAFYEASASGDYVGLADALGLPAPTLQSPVVESRGSLADADFTINISGWRANGKRTMHPPQIGGLLGRGDDIARLSSAQFALCQAIEGFALRGVSERTLRANQLAWGQIRRLALDAEANLDDFLARSVVLAPDTLRLQMRRARMDDGDSVVEIIPGFEDAPDDWLDTFDKFSEVRDEYHLPTAEGMLQVLVKPQVQTVLREIKRMPGRRMAGARAQAFIRNPFATLGDDAQQVVDEEQFETARTEAGLGCERFSPLIERDDAHKLKRVGLLIETITTTEDTTSERYWFTPDTLDSFLGKLETALRAGYQLLAWQGYDLELPDTAAALKDELQAVLAEWRGTPEFISWDDIHDLSRYSLRVEGIGEEKPYYSPYITKKQAGEWVPDNVNFAIGYKPDDGSEDVLVEFSPTQLATLQAEVETARRSGAAEVKLPSLPKPIPMAEAERLVGAFATANTTLPPKDAESETAPATKRHVVRQTLLLRSNIQQLDFDVRRKQLVDVPKSPQLPQSLRPEFTLFAHQRQGVAWLQHLYGARERLSVSGGVLADDMGLGKTLQLLAFMAELVEREPDIDPMLVVAPVALLQNWKQELERFFEPGALPLLVAYGHHLNDLKLPREAIDKRLREETGLVTLLRNGWVGGAKLVLTTYETLRNLEFSFAPQPWSVMVCDEAQKIKNPNAMVTRAAKKQKAAFKVACTGTPVENSLADLWCLFDYVQPGLLGPLDEFGKKYRKPIEAHTEEEKTHIEELRELIEPQILRRNKSEVAKDLPQKIIEATCRDLGISMRQRQLYAKAVNDFKKRDEPDAHVPFKNHLGLLHYLRWLCTDPRPFTGVAVLDRPLTDYRTEAPKMDWLLKQLRAVQAKGEKVIVFCEFRDIQRLLQHYIREDFGFQADIVNGDSVTDIARTDSRQKRIDAFQQAPGFGVIILSPVAVGFGLNIQAANHVIHYTRTWNPAKEDQATDRAFRIGQTRDVHVYYPTVTADDFSTFDAQLDRLLAHKRQLATDILNGSGEVGVSDFDTGTVAPSGATSNLDARIDMDTVRSRTGRYFEGIVAALWAKKESAVACCTPASGDHGVDAVIIDDKRGWLIQTKVSASNRGSELGWNAVKEVTGGEAFYAKQYPSVTFNKLCVTNLRFNTNAHKMAKLNHVDLVEGRQLEKLLKKHAIHESDVEALLYTSPY